MATRSMRPVLLPLALLAALAAPAFTGMSRVTPRTRIPRAADNFIPLDAIEPAVSSYVYLGLHYESQLFNFLRKIWREWIDEVSMCFSRSLWPLWYLFFSHLLKVLNLIAIPGGRGSKSHGELSYQEKATKQPKRILETFSPQAKSDLLPFCESSPLDCMFQQGTFGRLCSSQLKRAVWHQSFWFIGVMPVPWLQCCWPWVAMELSWVGRLVWAMAAQFILWAWDKQLLHCIRNSWD